MNIGASHSIESSFYLGASFVLLLCCALRIPEKPGIFKGQNIRKTAGKVMKTADRQIGGEVVS